MLKDDLENCSYIALSKNRKKCIEYRVDDADAVKILGQNSVILEKTKEDPTLRFAGLFCPNVGEAFFSRLPEPDTYRWEMPDKVLFQVSLEASKVLAYFANAKPGNKSLHDIKKASSLNEYSPEILRRALNELVEAKKLAPNKAGTAWALAAENKEI